MRRAQQAFVVLIASVLLAGCSAFIREWYVTPEPISQTSIPAVPSWAGASVQVTDARPVAPEPNSRSIDTGHSWQDYSSTLVEHTRAALVDALGPAQVGNPLQLDVRIVDNTARLDAPKWVGSTVLEATVLRAGQPTNVRWTATGNDTRFNWWGQQTARSASRAAYEAAVRDLLRQLTLTPPPA